MKPETTTEVLKTLPAAAGMVSTWSLHEASQATSIAVGLVTICYVLVQLFYLVRKWYVQEARHGLTTKKKPGSGFGDLDQP